MKRLFLILIVIIFPVQCFAITDEDEHDKLYEPVKLYSGIKLDIVKCLSIAFQNSPKIRRAMYELNVAKSETGIAKAQYFPIFNFGTGFNYERNSNSVYYDKKYRDLPSVRLQADKLIWNFGKTTSYIKMQKFYEVASEYEFMDSLCETLFDIKQKYYNLLKAKAMLGIAENNVKLTEKYVKNAHGKLKADKLTAQINFADAKIVYIEAKNNYDNAKTDLANSMYIDYEPDYDIEETKTFPFLIDEIYNITKIENNSFEPYKFPFEKEKAVDIAYETSPDLQVLIAIKNAMNESLKYIKKSYLPDINANVGYQFNNTNFASNNSLQTGVSLDAAINPMELKHSIAKANNELKLAENEIKLFKKDLYFEVKRAFNNVEKAQNQIPESKKEIKIALENLFSVEEAYNSNKLDYTSLQDAREDYILALNSYVKNLYDYNLALIQVEMAMHYHLVDIHHESEHAIKYHSKELEEHLNKVLECDRRDEVKPAVNKRRKK